MEGHILIVDDEPALLETLEMYLSERGYEVTCARNASEAIDLGLRTNPKVIILDVRLPDGDGLEVLRELKTRGCPSKVIVITAFHDMETTIRAIKLGASEYIPKPIDVEELEEAIRRALRLQPEDAEALRIDPNLCYEEGEIVGKSRPMKEIFKAIGKLSGNRVTVLIEGETGTGKELIARAIHYHSPFKDEPFLAINCSAIVGTLLESELFGHERGAFTGAISTKRGKFELAGRGTIFLDEVSEIPMELQAKLLRFLQEKEFQRVGGERILRSEARVIAASNRPLRKLVDEGRFREDLYYRLSVATIRVPPLRERTSDIPLLVRHLLQRINNQLGTEIKGIQERALQRMMDYPWPGNVRELENVLTKAALAAHGDVILEEDIIPLLEAEGGEPVAMSLQEVERAHILKVLHYTNWHYGKTCEILGISRPTLRQKMRRYGITPPLRK